MAGSYRLPTQLHRSRQKVLFTQRQHLHDGLRMMMDDVPREFGWLIQRSTTNVLIQEADECETKLYSAHDKAYRVGMILKKLKAEVTHEYEQRGEGQTFQEYIDSSRSFLVMMYKDKFDSMTLAMAGLMEETSNCQSTNAALKEEVKELQAEFADVAMHCRRLTAEEMPTLDVRVATELDGADHTAVVVPFRNVDELCHFRWTPHFEGDGRLDSYVKNGCKAFVGISCDVNAIKIAGNLTLLENPCLPPRLSPGTFRTGISLRILFLADNNLGAYNLRSILKGMRHSTSLEVFHCHSNGIGELGEGSSQQNPDAVDSLAAMTEIAEIVRSSGCPLRVLGLSKNWIGAAGLSRLMPGVALNQSITILDLSENSIGVSGANHIAKCLVTNRTLLTLNINNTMLTTYGLKAICSALKFNPTLRNMYTLKNVGPSARQDIFKSMQENTTMEVMHVFLDTPWINPNFLGPDSAVEMRKFDEVPGGVPFKNRVALLREFKTFAQISNASDAAIDAVPGMRKATSSAVYQYFNPPLSRSRGRSSGSPTGRSPPSRGSPFRGSTRGRPGALTNDESLAQLESKGYYQQQEAFDPWNITGCLYDDGPECVWEPVATESFRLEFSKKPPREDSSGPSGVSRSIPSPDRVSTTESRLLTPLEKLDLPPGTPVSGVDAFRRASSRASDGSMGTSQGVSGASQVEERLRANEAKRRAIKGVTCVKTTTAVVADLGPKVKPLAQTWGPPRKAGVNVIRSKQILGTGFFYERIALDKKHIRCSFCAQAAEEGRMTARVGQYGHEEFECPVNFFQTTGELVPGFNEYGTKIEGLWREGDSETVFEVEAMWDTLRSKGFFTEPSEGIPLQTRNFRFEDMTKAGKRRKEWTERGAFVSEDSALRKQMFESTGRGSPGRVAAGFMHGKDQFDAFLRERSGLSDSGYQTTNYDITPDEMSLALRSRLHLTGDLLGGAKKHDFTQYKDVNFVQHDGVKFIPSAQKRRELFLQKIRNNRFEDVQNFVDGIYGKIDACDKDPRSGCTALMQACQGGHKRIVKLLIKSKAEINTQDKKGNTALHYASTYGFQAVVDYLRGKEADESITNAQGYESF